MNGNVIEAKNLTKRYDGVAVVNGISFSVARGEIFGLLGPNGAGKTTTILMLLGLSDISDGQARVLGHDPAREPLAVKRQVGYLPDQIGFYDGLSAADNLRYTARLMGLERAEREQRISASLGHVGLADVADNRVSTFSRGMRQRLGVAEILMKEAQIAILDEPTSGLDPQATVELLEIIRDLKKRGVSVLLSSHLLERVQSVCDRVALFNQGKIALIGTVSELGREGVLSAKASAGQETSIPVILTNSGTAPAEQIELSGSVPTGWKVNFEPKTVDRIAPNENKEVQAMVTPAAKAVAGDYVTTVRAAARGESASQSFRVAVTTSTIWGIVGIALIGGALLVMIGAVVWFGRR